ncbi:hypothetical protein FNH07_27410, partial [Amycolatopsis bartoniae]
STTEVGKTYQIRTFGCQMNVHDSERLAGLCIESYGPSLMLDGTSSSVKGLRCGVFSALRGWSMTSPARLTTLSRVARLLLVRVYVRRSGGPMMPSSSTRLNIMSSAR